MHIQRRIERHQLPYYLKVFNRITDKPMGFIGNVSLDGLMLIFPNYVEGLQMFGAEILPGLRSAFA